MLDKVYNPREIEGKWSGRWKEAGVFMADAESDLAPYSIILPPPNITGILTIGHALGSTVQDLLIRWKRLRGFNVLWLPGTDHAGIATQKVVERDLRTRGLDREELGRERFVEKCFEWKDEYHRSIVDQLESLGASLDWSREAFTLDAGVSRAVREVFVRLYEKGLIYRSRYIVNWCPACGTAISDEEVLFEPEHGKLYYIAYPFADGGGEIVVGTTRPETMLGDVAVAVSLRDEQAGEMKGRLLRLPLAGRDIPIILDEAVDPEFGTGRLKVTPAHDATDFEIGLRHGLDPFVVIGRDGRMNEAAGRYGGLPIMEARERILHDLEEQGLLRGIEDYDHSVGHHDRCGEMIEPTVSKQWFLKMKELAEPAIRAVRGGEVVFTPERWMNIYLNWMENIRDWCISRQIWWGHRIPVWYCTACEAVIVSVEEPAACRECGGAELVQDEDVLDTWFSSWLWTFSPMGWPEETKDLEVFHPTDVLVTGGDIIFFWVARMIMASLEFMGEIPFRTVYITGIVRDAEGFKMSKSLGNSPDMIDVIDTTGADALRFSLVMLSPPGQDLLFDVGKVDVGRHFANKIWNAARFVLGRDVTADEAGWGEGPIPELYASLFGERPNGAMEFQWEERWIASRLRTRFDEMERALESFRFDEAARIVYDFFWHEFCDWYLELSKGSFREGGARERGVTVTARSILGASLAMLHPFMPFLTEEIWGMLGGKGGLLAGFVLRVPEAALSDVQLEEDVALFREIVTSIRNMRQGFGIEPSRDVDIIISCTREKGFVDNLELFRDQIARLARVGGLEIGEALPKPEGSAATGLTAIEIYMPLKDVIDIDAEKERLDKSLQKLADDIGKIEARLADEGFLGKAPPEVVERERERFRDMDDRMQRMRKIREDLD